MDIPRGASNTAFDGQTSGFIARGPPPPKDYGKEVWFVLDMVKPSTPLWQGVWERKLVGNLV